MKHRYIRSAAAILLALTSLLTSASCGKGAEEVKLTNVFRTETLDIPNTFEHIMQMYVKSGRLYLYGYDNETYMPTVYVMNEDGSDGSKVEFETDEAKNENVDALCIMADGSFYTTVNSWFMNEETGEYSDNMSLVHFGADGKRLESANLTDIIVPENERGYVYVNSMVSDGEGRLYMVCESTIYIVKDGALSSKIDIEADYIEKILVDKNGSLLVFYYDTTNYDSQIKTIDPE